MMDNFFVKRNVLKCLNFIRIYRAQERETESFEFEDECYYSQEFNYLY